jgi:hypothetical protein
MSTPQFETERRGLIRATLGALVIATVPRAAAAPPVQTPTTIRKASPPRGSYGIVQPGIKRTAFLKVPAGMTNDTFRDYWINTYAPDGCPSWRSASSRCPGRRCARAST